MSVASVKEAGGSGGEGGSETLRLLRAFYGMEHPKKTFRP